MLRATFVMEVVARAGNTQKPPRAQGRTSRISTKPDLAKNNFAKKELKQNGTNKIISEDGAQLRKHQPLRTSHPYGGL